MKVAVTVLALIACALIAYGGLTLWKNQQVAGSDAAAAALQQEADARELVEVTFVVTAPENTPADQTVYVSGSHPQIGAWEAAGLPLEKQDDGTYRGSCELLSGVAHEFKVTRGSWSTVERTADDEEVENRPFVVEAGQEVLVTVEDWVDDGQTVPGRNTAVPGLRLHERRFFSTVDSTKPRSLVVYLPPGYDDDPEKRYPVLYVHDGQNLFNESTSFNGVEWGLDEAAQRQIESGAIEPIIIVGVYNTEDRDVEYGTGVAAYADHFADTLKPFIDETYRTLPDREHTTLAGAALGGRAAIEVARHKPDLFGTVVALSPFVVDEGGSSLLDGLAGDGDAQSWAANTRFRLDTANTTQFYATESPVEDLTALADWLEAAGADVERKIIENGEHREASWGQRAGLILLDLYGSDAETISRLSPLRVPRWPSIGLEQTSNDWRAWMKDLMLAPRSSYEAYYIELFKC